MRLKTCIIMLVILIAFAASLNAVVDDHGNTSLTATPVIVATETSGNIETYSDVDYFRFTADENMLYTITVTLESLPDSWMILYSTDGITQIMFNDDNTDALSSKIEWTCPEGDAGTYFVSVAGYDYYNTGRYTLLITAEESTKMEGCFIASASYKSSMQNNTNKFIINNIKKLLK